MKKLVLFFAAIAAAASLRAQVPPPVTQWPNGIMAWDGGLPVPAGYLTIKDETTALAPQSILSFLGAGVTCVNNAGNAATECTISGGSGLGDPGGNGIVARTALNTTINRTIVCAASYCTWANGDGVAGAPSLTLVPFVASGGSHSSGTVPDPGATAGTDNYLREDATWVNPFTDTNTLWMYTDLVGISSGGVAPYVLINGGTGANNRVSASGLKSHPGIMTLERGTTAASFSDIDATNIAGGKPFTLDTGTPFTAETNVDVVTALSDGTNTYTYAFGFMENPTVTIPANDGIYFSYQAASDTHWRINTCKTSTCTTTNTTNTVTVGQYDALKITCNSTLTSCSFFVNGTEASGSPLSTNIPTGRDMDFTCGTLLGTAGTLNRVINVDYCKLYLRTTTAR